MKIIWPWQWKKIAQDTLKDLQATRDRLREVERENVSLRGTAERVQAKNAELTEQVRRMSQR